MLYIVLFLHQTTTIPRPKYGLHCCISFFSYIKPQQFTDLYYGVRVVYRSFPTSNHNGTVSAPSTPAVVYRSFPTSNHNLLLLANQDEGLYIVLFLHQTTTANRDFPTCVCCISFFSYIKPQRSRLTMFMLKVVYRSFPTSNHNAINIAFACLRVVYRSFPTSNHNASKFFKKTFLLYIVLFLHQTTTCECVRFS